MKTVYCAKCGKRLGVIRKALPKYATVINIVEYHKCSEIPVEFDLKPVDTLSFNEGEEKSSFIQTLSSLNSKTVTAVHGSLSSNDLRDRRFEPDEEKEAKMKSSAPGTLLSMLKDLNNSIPEHEPVDLKPEREE